MAGSVNYDSSLRYLWRGEHLVKWPAYHYVGRKGSGISISMNSHTHTILTNSTPEQQLNMIQGVGLQVTSPLTKPNPNKHKGRRGGASVFSWKRENQPRHKRKERKCRRCRKELPNSGRHTVRWNVRVRG